MKEADALHEAGFVVRVVAGDSTTRVRPFDDLILAGAPWRVTRVSIGARPLRLARRIRQEVARRALEWEIGDLRATVWAHSAISISLAKAASAEPADLYIGHCLAALPAVAWSARYHGAKFGFDAEDDHLGELMSAEENPLEFVIRQRIEAHFLPQCDYLTAASPGIVQAYRDRYGVTMTPILNVFPLAEAPPSERRAHVGNELSLYWFSQTIGPGRGLEQFIISMGKMRCSAVLSIRGSDFLGYSARLKALAAEAGVADAIRILPSASPSEMVRLAAQHDVGLSLELNTPPCRAICLTNKIFTYLLAGIPTLLSDTPAQRELALELGQAARVASLTSPDLMAEVLDSWASDAKSYSAASSEAWRLGRTKFNWDIEKKRFIKKITDALG